MKKECKKSLFVGISFIFIFVIWTILIKYVDLQQIGPRDSIVGFSTLNKFFHSLTGSNLLLYVITDWLGLVPIFVALCFAILGLAQWIKRKSFLKVDRSILVLGGFYIITILFYVFFE